MIDQGARNDELFGEIHRLVTACLEGNPPAAARQRLEDLISGDPSALDVYVKYLSDSISLRCIVSPPIVAEVMTRALTADTDSGMSLDPSAGPRGQQFLPSVPAGLWPGTVGFFSSGWPLAYLIAAVVLSIGMLVGAFTHVSQPVQVAGTDSAPALPLNEPPADVGRVAAMADCRWATAGVPLRVGDAVPIGQKIKLESGLLEVAYNTGAKVILQGHITYEVDSPTGGFLSVGKLTARVDNSKTKDQRPKTKDPHPSSLIPHPLFVVRTPTATVTDLGTEFGVEVNNKGSTTSRVFRGSVEVRPVLLGGRIGESTRRIVRENESVRVEAGDTGPRVTLVPTSTCSRFVREIHKHTIKVLDLVDVVAGGDGFSSRRNRGIDPTTGRKVDGPPNAARLVGDGRYYRVEGLPFVDGVFVPGNHPGPVQVDSAGHTFDRFGNVSNETWHYVWAGGTIPVNDRRRAISAVLGGVDYSSPGHGLLYMHANKGITFDLDAIRRANPGDKVVRFRTVVGNTDTAAALGVRRSTSAKPLLANDFETAAVGPLPNETPRNLSTVPNTGTWASFMGHVDQAQIAAEPISNGAGSNNYLKIHRAHVRVAGWNVSDTDGQIVQMRASVRVSSETGARALLDGFAGPGDFENRSFSVYLGADGSVTYYNGSDFVTTDLVSHPDTWQNVVVTANMGTHTFSIRLDDQPACTGSWLGGATRVSHVLVGNDTAYGTVSFDNIRLNVKPSTSEYVKPERLAADAWVLVDGERRSGRLGFNAAYGVYPIVVPIAENDRFLTLVATDGGDSLFWDWVFFGDPRLEMISVGGRHETSVKAK
jgi:hypothetical protein